MKRLASGLLALLLCVLLAGCGAAQSTSSIPESTMNQLFPGRTGGEDMDPPIGGAPYARVASLNLLTGLPAPEDMSPDARPVAVMVLNEPGALPQRGLSVADVLIEAPLSDGHTGLLALYADYRALPQVGPVGPAEDVFLQMAMPYNAIFTHIDGTIYTENLLNAAGYQDIDGVYMGSTAFIFDETRHRAAPGDKVSRLCWYVDASSLWRGMEHMDVYTGGAEYSLFYFAAAGTGQPATTISVQYTAAAGAEFTYDPESGRYLKGFANGSPHMEESGAQLAYDNVLLLQCNVGAKADNDKLLDFGMTTGQGYYFVNGRVQAITWEKGAANQQLRLYDANDNPLPIEAGNSYIGLVPAAEPGHIEYAGPAGSASSSASGSVSGAPAV